MNNSANDLTFLQKMELLKGRQKTRRGVSAYTLYVNRPAARFIAAAMPARIAPNHLTVASAVFSFLALGLIWVTPWVPELRWYVAPLLIVGYILDSSDGQLARLRGASSRYGEWLDHTVDAGKIAFLHVSAIFFFVSSFEPELSVWLMGLGALFLISAIINYVGGMLAAVIVPANGKIAPPIDGKVKSVLMLPTDPGVVNFSFLFLFWPAAFMWAYITFAFFMTAFVIMIVRKWTLELRYADQRANG